MVFYPNEVRLMNEQEKMPRCRLSIQIVVLEVGLALKNDVLIFNALLKEVVLEVGLEPTKPEGERFTVSCHCH